MERVILHSDMNNFYASVECLYNPALRGKPVAVAGDPQARHGIVLAKNNAAKAYGVQTGEPLWMAQQKCRDIVFTPPHYDRYLRFSKLAQEIYNEYTDQIEPFGLDECWLDVSGSTGLFGDGKKIADTIRRRVKDELGITASVGVSYNKIFAKLGSDMKKPDATTVIPPDGFRTKVWPLPASDLLYVGKATQRKLARYYIHTIGDLATASPDLLCRLLGKNGVMLWRFANGMDSSPVSQYGEKALIKSIGNSTTTPRDLLNEEDIKITLYALCESVSARLREQGFVCRTVQISIRDHNLFTYERQGKLAFPNRTVDAIFTLAMELYRQSPPKNPVRSLGVRACDLTFQDVDQLSFLPEMQKIQKKERLDQAVDSVRNRFGHFVIQRGIMLTDTDLSNLDPKNDHTIHPEQLLNKMR